LIVAGAAFGGFSLTIFMILVINAVRNFTRKIKRISEV
jgi:hypothetical protein